MLVTVEVTQADIDAAAKAARRYAAHRVSALWGTSITCPIARAVTRAAGRKRLGYFTVSHDGIAWGSYAYSRPAAGRVAVPAAARRFMRKFDREAWWGSKPPSVKPITFTLDLPYSVIRRP